MCDCNKVELRANDVRQGLDVLHLLNSGGDIRNMLDEADQKFDFRQFRGHLDLERASIIGHSFGGCTAVLALSKEQRFK